MANPQLENGYTRIANEILEVIYGTNFNATQLKIILCVIRYTYGFGRKSHSLSVSFINKATGISKRYISSELSKLIKNKVLIGVEEYTVTKSRKLQLNKNYKEWIGYRTILHQMNNPSPDEQLISTTDEQSFTTTDEELFTQERKTKESIKERDFKSVYDYYLSLSLIKHRAYTKDMQKAIEKAMKDNKYDIEYCKTLLKRHGQVVEITKGTDYPVKARGLSEFFGQKVWGATHLICSEYDEGGKYYEQYIKESEEVKNPTEPFVPKFKYFDL